MMELTSARADDGTHECPLDQTQGGERRGNGQDPLRATMLARYIERMLVELVYGSIQSVTVALIQRQRIADEWILSTKVVSSTMRWGWMQAYVDELVVQVWMYLA